VRTSLGFGAIASDVKIPAIASNTNTLLQEITNNEEISFISFLNCLQHNKSVISRSILIMLE